MHYNQRPDISTRETIELCLSHIEDMEFAKTLRLRQSIVGDSKDKTIPKPLRVVDGSEVYLRLDTGCPYKNCPNAIAAMTLRGPRAGEVLALCASPKVGSAYVAMTQLNPDEIEQIM